MKNYKTFIYLIIFNSNIRGKLSDIRAMLYMIFQYIFIYIYPADINRFRSPTWQKSFLYYTSENIILNVHQFEFVCLSALINSIGEIIGCYSINKADFFSKDFQYYVQLFYNSPGTKFLFIYLCGKVSWYSYIPFK